MTHCPHCGKDLRGPERERLKSAHDDEQNEWFADFWALFPRKVSRKAAEKAWKRAATSERVKDEIMAGLKHFVDCDWRNTPKQFIPHAATWLNGRRWEDELSNNALQLPRPPERPASAKCDTCWDTGILSITESGVGFCPCGAPHDPIFDQEGAGSAVAG
jgi:hypothetical protein